MRSILAFATAFLACSISAMAMPPFVYESALGWSDRTVISDIPLNERIYILGPKKETETYILDNKPAQHEVEVRQAIASNADLTLGQALSALAYDRSESLVVAVYRKTDSKTLNTIMPVVTLNGKEASSSTLRLQARDVIWLHKPFTGLVL